MNHIQSVIQSIGRRIAFLLIAIVMAASAGTTASACPSCDEGDAVTNSKQEGLSQGLSYSVIGLLSVPFLIVGTAASVIVRARKRMREGEQHQYPNDSI